jgi:ABC-type transport system involved in multi-copper enzyme maturation permease subunit
VQGSGRIGPENSPDDIVEIALFGALGGMIALIALGVLFATSEYRRGMIRTTFAATPHRGQVLAAKAVVLGGAAFVIGLVGNVVAVLVALPTMAKHGFAPPAYPRPSLVDGSVLRAIVLTAAFVACVTVFSLGLGTILRRSAGAVTLGIVLLMMPVIVGTLLPGTPAKVLMYATLAGGFATERAKPPSIELAEPWAMLSPWAGIGVVSGYAAAALLLAWWLLRRRDA